MKAKLIKHDKITDEAGNTIEIKMWVVPKTADKPYGFKYSLVYIVNNKRIVGYDNAEGKGDHRHYKEGEEPLDSPKNNFTFSHLNLQAIFGQSSIANYSK